MGRRFGATSCPRSCAGEKTGGPTGGRSTGRNWTKDASPVRSHWRDARREADEEVKAYKRETRYRREGAGQRSGDTGAIRKAGGSGASPSECLDFSSATGGEPVSEELRDGAVNELLQTLIVAGTTRSSSKRFQRPSSARRVPRIGPGRVEAKLRDRMRELSAEDGGGGWTGNCLPTPG